MSRTGDLLGAAAIGAALLIRASQTRRIRRRCESGADAARQRFTPDRDSRIRIVQPIRSGDPRLRETLTDTLTEHGTKAERVVEWLIDADDQLAADTIESILLQHDLGDCVVVLTMPAAPDGVNPKTWKLAKRLQALDADNRDVFLVLDDDTRLSEAGLRALIRELDAGAMIATAFPRYERRGPLPSRLLADWVNGQAPTTYLGLPGPARSVNGMCYAIRTRDLIRLGGFSGIQHLVVDDLAMCEIVRSAGGRIAQTTQPLTIGTDVRSFLQLASILHRWMVFAQLNIRRGDAAERWLAIRQLVAPQLLFAGGLATAGHLAFHNRSRFSLVAAMLGITARAALIRANASVTRTLDSERAFASAVMEIAALPAAATATINPAITWRARRYRIGRDATMTAQPSTSDR